MGLSYCIFLHKIQLYINLDCNNFIICNFLEQLMYNLIQNSFLKFLYAMLIQNPQKGKISKK